MYKMYVHVLFFLTINQRLEAREVKWKKREKDEQQKRKAKHETLKSTGVFLF